MVMEWALSEKTHNQEEVLAIAPGISSRVWRHPNQRKDRDSVSGVEAAAGVEAGAPMRVMFRDVAGAEPSPSRCRKTRKPVSSKRRLKS